MAKYKNVMSLEQLLAAGFLIMESNPFRMYKIEGSKAAIFQKVTNIMSLYEKIYHGEKKYIQKMLDKEEIAANYPEDEVNGCFSER